MTRRDLLRHTAIAPAAFLPQSARPRAGRCRSSAAKIQHGAVSSISNPAYATAPRIRNALADARHKYIFHALDASEQLFNLSRDPAELHDLAADPAYWVKGGRLVPRLDDPAYSPNFPVA